MPECNLKNCNANFDIKLNLVFILSKLCFYSVTWSCQDTFALVLYVWMCVEFVFVGLCLSELIKIDLRVHLIYFRPRSNDIVESCLKPFILFRWESFGFWHFICTCVCVFLHELVLFAGVMLVDYLNLSPLTDCQTTQLAQPIWSKCHSRTAHSLV